MASGRFFIDVSPLRHHPELRRLFVGLLISSCGTQISMVAIQLQTYVISGSSLDVGLVALVQLGPLIVGSVLGGSIADSMDRRKMLMITQSSMAMCALVLALNATLSHPQLWVIFVIAALNGGFSGADSPARTALLMSMADRETLVVTGTLRQIIQQTATVVGPSIGGVLIAGFGFASVYWVNAITFGALVVAVLTLRARPPNEDATKFGLKSIFEGFAFLKGRPIIQACFVADLNAMVLGMPTALFPALGLHHFHGGSRTVGLLYAAPGIGAFIAATFCGWASRIRRQGRAVIYAVACWGLAITAFGFSDVLWLGLLLLTFAGCADVVSALFRNVILQAETPDRLRGRLSSFHTAVTQSGPRVGNFEAGSVAALAGTQLSVITGGLGCVVGAVLIAKFMPKFAHYELMAEPREIDHSETAETTAP